MIAKQSDDLYKGFSQLNRQQRLEYLVKIGVLTPEDVNTLSNKQTPEPALAETLIENVIGYFSMPLGVAVNFRIDGIDRVIPMAVEETSIVAAASKTARFIRQHGELTTETSGHLSIGQIQIAKVQHFSHLHRQIVLHEKTLIADANQHVANGLIARGGGIAQLEVRRIARDDGYDMAVIHIMVNTCDAMGANIINQICEYLRTPIEELTGEKVTMCILSNLNDSKLTRAKAVLHNIDPELGYKIEEASIFAEQDPYRAATNNKGVLNGMDPILLATGNDWRAVEAGVHAYAARSGQYRSITRWRVHNNDLIGEIEAPISVGIVGGVTKIHPTAATCLSMLNIQHADELARIIAAVGLTQNLGALRALTTVGIIQGHMKLHIDNLILATDAKEDETLILKQQLTDILRLTKRITMSNAIELLQQIRANRQI